MPLRLYMWLCLGVLAATALAGCASNDDYLKYYKAMSARQDCQPTYNESTQFFNTYMERYRPPHPGSDQDYVMWSMDYVSLCLLGGNYDAAYAELMKCREDINNRFDQTREGLATATSEAHLIFKGEHFERAMVCTYLSLLSYMRGNYNDARIFAAQANMENAKKAEDMKAYRDDFQLSHYLLGRSFLHLGQEDNARIAFQKASEHLAPKNEESELAMMRKAQETSRERRIRMEKESYALATNPKQPVAGAVDMSDCMPATRLPAELPGYDKATPILAAAESRDEFFSLDFQRQVNLILVIETGTAPLKYLTGPDGCLNAIMRSPYEEHEVVVYVDGHNGGETVRLLDMAGEASTRGINEKDAVRLTKGTAKMALSYVPYAGMAAALWDVSADCRYWHLLPGEVHVFAAKVAPGLHTVTLQCLDSNGNLLPRYRVTRYYVPARAEGESVILMHVYPEADNTYVSPENENLYKSSSPGVRRASAARAAGQL